MQNAADIGCANSRIELKEIYALKVDPRAKWYINQDCKVYGPMTWNKLKAKAKSAQVTPFAQIKEENWPRWVPIMYYFRVKTPAEKEAEALLPGENDAMFSLGVFIFIIGIFCFFIVPIIGIFIFIISPIVEWDGIYSDMKSKGMSIVGTLGNAMAISWMIIQVIVTILLVGMWFALS